MTTTSLIATSKEVKQVLRGINTNNIVDKKGKKAWQDCLTVFQQLQFTVKQFFIDEFVSIASPALDAAGPKSILKGQTSKTAQVPRPPSRAASAISSIETVVTAKTSQEKEEEGSDGPSLFNYNGQVVTRSAMELLEEEEDMIARGVYERDGVLMTASALSLLQAQEMMQRGDSAGHGAWGRRLPRDLVADDEREIVLLDIG